MAGVFGLLFAGVIDGKTGKFRFTDARGPLLQREYSSLHEVPGSGATYDRR
jgi:hypothetical protein